MGNTEYTYEDAGISSILDCGLLQDNLTKSTDMFTVAPIVEQKNILVEFLSNKKKDHHQWPNRILFIPYLIGRHKDGYWIGVVVRFQNNIVQKISSCDPLFRPLTKKIKEDLMQIYGKRFSLEEPVRKNNK